MLLTDFKRIVRAGFLNFWRNGFVSLASVLVITITLFVIGSLIFFNALMEESLRQIKNKVDIDVYFALEAEEEDVVAIRRSLEELPEVASVTYTSRDEALEEFRARHADDFLTLQALEELGENPLGASLNIKAKETSQYESVARFLDNQNAAAGEGRVIDKINYYQNKTAIDRLTQFIDGAETIGIAVIAVLAVIAVVITFNTIRLAIYTSREEVAVMRLVGAGNKYIRGPFLVEGFMYGVISAILVLILFYPLTFWLGDKTAQFFGDINIFNYYIENFGQIFLIIVVSGIVLGMTSSFFAVRRYISKKYLKL